MQKNKNKNETMQNMLTLWLNYIVFAILWRQSALLSLQVNEI